MAKRGSERRQYGEKIGDRVSIRQRDKTWYANWQEHGRQHRESLKTTSKKEAISRAWRIEREIDERAQGLKKPVEPTSIEAAIAAYDEFLVSESRAPKTLAKYRLVFGRIKQVAHERKVETLDRLDLGFLDTYRAMRKRDGAAEKTRYTESTIVRQLVLFALSRCLIATDPMGGRSLQIRKPKYKQQPCWTREEAERIVANAREPFATAFVVLLDAGLRAGELSHLTKADIDFKANVIHVRPKLDWRPKTGDARAVPMTPRVAGLLQKQVSGLKATDWVFTAQTSVKHPETGRRLTERRLLAALKRVTKRLDLPGHLHTFRHTFISLALMNNVPESVVRKWAGHVDPEILKYYTHVFDATGQAEMLRFSRAAAGEIKEGEEENVDARRIGA